jgi:6,7-dimethyl-8-ribityllumazine synthase
MLKPVKKNSGARLTNGRVAIVASKYNARYVDSMLRAAKTTLAAAGVKDVQVVRVPGAFEIPMIAAQLAHCETNRPDVIICLGVVIQGETAHAQLISEAVSQSLARIQIDYRLPVIHGVLLLGNEAQAKARCLGSEHNRGTEAALTAIEMARINRSFCKC